MVDMTLQIIKHDVLMKRHDQQSNGRKGIGHCLAGQLNWKPTFKKLEVD